MINAAKSASEGSAQVWTRASTALRLELGDDAFGSWLAPADLRCQSDGAVCLVTPTGIARDWIRRHAWRRVEELWAANDPDHRPLRLKSRVEFEACGEPRVESPSAPAPRPVKAEAATQQPAPKVSAPVPFKSG